MKKTVKKPVKRSSVTIEDLRYLPSEITKLNNRIEQLEQSLAKITLSGNKEPETFEDCIKGKDGYNTGLYGTIIKCESLCHSQVALENGSAVPSEKRAKQLAAIAKMMTVADALNGDYTSKGWEITYNIDTGKLEPKYSYCRQSLVSFPNIEIANKIIKILGEDTIRTAFGI